MECGVKLCIALEQLVKDDVKYRPKNSEDVSPYKIYGIARM